MKIKVTANNYNKDYFTVGKVYDADRLSKNLFTVRDDEGDLISCLLRGCVHGYEYEIVDDE